MRQARLPYGREGSASCRCWRRIQVTVIAPSVGDDSERKQRRQMLVALALLLAALILVLIKDRDFWFPPEPPAQSESEPVEEPSSDVKAPPETASTSYAAAGSSHPAEGKAHPAAPVGAIPSPAPALAPVVMTRAVLPPLEVEVVAGDEHRTIQSTSNSVKVDLAAENADHQLLPQSSSPGSSSPSSGAASGSASPIPRASPMLPRECIFLPAPPIFFPARCNRTIPCWPRK